MEDDLESAAARLEATDDYRVLRRLRWPPPLPTAEGAEVRRGLYLDVETTGLDVDADEIIEFGAIPFIFTLDGRIVHVAQVIHSYNRPSKPISPEIECLTGVTGEMVKGAKLPDLSPLAREAQLVVAHHAEFDRQMIERACPAFARVCWGCSMSQVPWDDVFGISGRRLEYVLAALGRFYDAHNSISDCKAGLYALGAKDKGGRTAFAHLLDASRATTWHAWAIDAPYAAKDRLRARGYAWNSGEDGRPKAWHKEVDDKNAEEVWLRNAIYGPSLIRQARFIEVTAFDRFTKRTAP